MSAARGKNLRDWPVIGGAAIVCAVITAAAWGLAVQPALSQRSQRQVQLRDLSIHRHKSAILSANRTKARLGHAAAREDLARIALALKPATEVNARLAGITKLASDCRLTIDEVQPGQTAPAAGYQQVELKIAGSGAYPAVVQFLHQLHQNFRDLGVRAISLVPDSGNVLTPNVRFRLDLIWYAAPATVAPAPGRSAVAGTD
jgi:Tfp pilus assembly protein PilO